MPKPKGLEAFIAQVTARRELVLDGRLLCIDPASGASSPVGWAEYVNGEYTRSGVIQPKASRTVAVRLREIQAEVQRLGLGGADLVVIERLRGRKVHNTLHWATGVLVAAAAKDRHIEIPIPCWKCMAEADPTYVKGDIADARAMGSAVVRVARGLGLPDRVSKATGRGRTVRRRTPRTSGVRPTKRRASRVASKKPRRPKRSK